MGQQETESFRANGRCRKFDRNSLATSAILSGCCAESVHSGFRSRRFKSCHPDHSYSFSPRRDAGCDLQTALGVNAGASFESLSRPICIDCYHRLPQPRLPRKSSARDTVVKIAATQTRVAALYLSGDEPIDYVFVYPVIQFEEIEQRE